MFYDLPSWALRMDLWELAGVVAYTFSFALIEAMLLTLPFMLIAFFLPARWREVHWFGLSAVAMLTATLVAIALQVTDQFQQVEKLVAMLWLALNVGLGFFLVRKPDWSRGLQSFTERLIPLVVLFVSLDIVSLIVVLVRNL